MPELPEVETTRRGLAQSIKGACITKVEQRRADLRFPFPPHLKERLEGRRILGVRRRAKYLLIDLEGGLVMLAHLGMSGSFTVLKAKAYAPRKHDHFLLTLDNGLMACFHDPRRFGIIDLFDKMDEKKHKLLAHLGPEPLAKTFSTSYLKAALLKRSRPIKTTLMDQKLVVGVGNIYASESLFRAGINPTEKSSNCTKMVGKLIPAIQATLQAAIDSGGSTLRDYVGARGEGGYFQHQFLVYDRDGKPCVSCSENIAHLTQAGRATYFCPTCQPLTRRK